MYTACLNLEVSRPELPLDLDSASATVPATGANAAWDSGEETTGFQFQEVLLEVFVIVREMG